MVDSGQTFGRDVEPNMVCYSAPRLPLLARTGGPGMSALAPLLGGKADIKRVK
jgi:hypothetical protein